MLQSKLLYANLQSAVRVFSKPAQFDDYASSTVLHLTSDYARKMDLSGDVIGSTLNIMNILCQFLPKANITWGQRFLRRCTPRQVKP